MTIVPTKLIITIIDYRGSQTALKLFYIELSNLVQLNKNITNLEHFSIYTIKSIQQSLFIAIDSPVVIDILSETALLLYKKIERVDLMQVL